jgi:hypothetical protein
MTEQTNTFDETLKLASYGEASSGKTLQIAYLIDEYGPENVAIINRDRGLSTIRSTVEQHPEMIYTLDGSIEDRRASYAWAKERNPQWLAVDGGTRIMQDIQAMVFGGAERAYEAVLNGKKKDQLDADLKPYAVFITSALELNSQGLWGRVKSEAERFFNGFCSLPSNLYFTFWDDKPMETFGKAGTRWMPDAPGKGARDAIQGTFDFIFRLTNEGKSNEGRNKFRAVTQPTLFVYAKSRNDLRGGIDVPAQIDDFKLINFIQLVRGESKSSSSKEASSSTSS